MKVLVIDNDPKQAKDLLKTLLLMDNTWECAGTTVLKSALAAVNYAEKPFDVAFLNVSPDFNGIGLARALHELAPRMNIIFYTEHKEYAYEAFGVRASAYLLRPATEEAIRDAMDNLRFPAEESNTRRLAIRCFGSFDVFYAGRPVKFKRSKTKELLAYLIDRRGARASMSEVLGVLWEDGVESTSRRAQVRNLISDLRGTLDALGAEDAIVRSRDAIAIVPEAFDCDYYRYLDGDPISANRFQGEYMSQYWWSESTLANLQMI